MQTVKKTYKLFLDDYRAPIDAFLYTGYIGFKTEDWYIVKNYVQFIDYIGYQWEMNNAFPEIIAFDHDLADEDQESWLPIKNYEGIYNVSNLGNVNRILIEKGTSGGVLKPSKNESGLFVTLRNKGNDQKLVIHRLVLESFNGININKPCVNHKDGNRWNNNLNNLEWCTNSENVKHSHDYLDRDYTAYGENHNNSKVVSKYLKNGDYFGTYGSVNEAGRQENIQFTNIAKCARGERKSAGGFIWKYDDKDVTLKSKTKHIPKKDKNYAGRFFIPKLSEKTGMDCAKWLVDFCIDNELKLPPCICHSMNPVGRENISSLLRNFKNSQNDEERSKIENENGDS